MTDTTRPCAGCGKQMAPDQETVMHYKRYGDIPFCSDDCLDANIARVWHELGAEEERARRLIGISP